MSISAAPNNLTTGQPATLECTIVAVQGISSTVDIIWYMYADGLAVEVRRADNVTAINMINSTIAVYKDVFIISSLTRQHNGRLYSCQAVINDELLLIIPSSPIRLHVICKCRKKKLLYV